jgi:hypothetical protein
MKIPIDNQEMTEKFKIDKGGICGQACLAVIEECSIQQVLDNWANMKLQFKGWSGWKQLKSYLENRGFKVKQIRMKEFKIAKTDVYYIFRVQWLGEGKIQEKPFYGYNHWSEASAYTHFILLHNGQVFCNETGIFDYHELSNYLDNAVLTSAFEVSK